MTAPHRRVSRRLVGAVLIVVGVLGVLWSALAGLLAANPAARPVTRATTSMVPGAASGGSCSASWRS